MMTHYVKLTDDEVREFKQYCIDRGISTEGLKDTTDGLLYDIVKFDRIIDEWLDSKNE